MDISYAANDESYATPDSNPWGVGGAPSGKQVYGDPNVTADGFYDTRDDMVGGTDTQWNEGSDHVAGAKWASYGDSTPVVNAPAGVGGERAKFSGTLSQSDLAG